MKDGPPGTEHRRRLLDHARRRVSSADIEACAIASDPGYPRYVEQMTTVMRTGMGIDRVEWEVLFHATNDDPMTQPDPTRSRRYRVLAAAVGAVHPALAELVSPTQVAVSLVEDALADPDSDPELISLVYASLRELAEELGERDCNDAPFVWLAALLVGAAAGHDDTELSTLALRVFDEEARFQRTDKRSLGKTFLWRCSKSWLDEKRWMQAIEIHLPASTQSLASLRTVLLRRLTAV